MTLITLSELKAKASIPSKNITLTGWTDPQLQEEIDWAVAYIQRESNRVFNDQTFTQTSTDHEGDCIFLHPTPIKSITTFTIDDVTVSENDYTLNKSTGVIELTTEPTGEYSYSVTYVVCEDNEDIITIASDICMDLAFLKIEGKTDDTPEVQSFKSGNSQISYSKPNPMTTIKDRIAAIKKNEIYLGMI